MRKLEQIVVPEVKRRQSQKSHPVAPDLLSWMVEGAKDEREGDPYMLTKLLAALNAGGTYSSANFIVSVIIDLVAHPKFLEEIREEILEKHAEVNGIWDYTAFHSLHKLDSAMKETARLSPGSLTTFSRVLLGEYTLSNGIRLKKGQFVCVSSYCRSMDPALITNPETYDALRAYNHDFNDHLARPFKNVYATNIDGVLGDGHAQEGSSQQRWPRSFWSSFSTSLNSGLQGTHNRQIPSYMNLSSSIQGQS